MNFVSTPVGQATQPSAITIDWSNVMSTQGDAQADIDRMIAWVKTYPQHQDVHVYLGALRRTELGRKLQAALQALGCRVTSRAFALNSDRPAYAIG